MILLTAAAGGSGAYRDTGPITTAHLILIAVLAALTIAGLVWGMRLKRQRRAAEAEEAARAEALAAHPEPVATQQQVQRQSSETMSPPVAPPVAPAPPPLGDMGLGQPDRPAVATAGYDLADIKGLGPKAVPLLAAQGVASVADLAVLTDARAAEVDAGMGALKGRLVRDRWVEQARLLDAGDRAGFEATFGKL